MPGGGGLINVGGRAYTPSIEYTFSQAIDEVDANTTYIGLAPAGTLASEAGWQIKKLIVSGTVTLIPVAGDGEFDQVWNDRASLTYSI